LRLADRRIRQPGRQGHHRPDQGGSRGDPERGFGCRAADHHRSHGSGSTEEERRRRHACGWRRHGRYGWYGLLSPTVQRSKEKERPGSDAGPFCISYTSISTTIAAWEVTTLKGSSRDVQHFADG